MAQANFYEIFRCVGVDQNANPPGIIVPFRGSNQVVLETSGMDLHVPPIPGILLEEFDGKDISRKLIEINNALYQPDVDSQFKEAFLPTATHWYNPRFFRIHGNAATGFPGVLVRATPVPVPGRRAPSIGATLRVVVLKPMTFKIAIRNVRARDQQGTLRYHASQPCDARKELANMNLVWTPQANVSFDLISSEDVTIDHNDKSTQEELRKAYGLKEASTAVFGHAAPEILAEKNWEVFANRKIPGADITFFVVNQVRSKGRSAAGVMNANFGISFIAGQHFPTTFAHEAGHFLGRYMNNGEWNPLDHQIDTMDKQRDLRMLMRDGGSGWMIPFELVKKFREFSNKPPAH
jgi:hypothetical protein